VSETPYFTRFLNVFRPPEETVSPWGARGTWGIPLNPPSDIGVNQRLPQSVEITRGYLVSPLRGPGQTLSPVEAEVRRKTRGALVTRPLPGQGEKPFPGAISPDLKTPGFRKE